MNRKRLIRQWIAVALLAAACITYVISALVGTGRSDVNSAAVEMSRRVEFRMARLDLYIQQAMEGDLSSWMDLQGLPEDMVVYRYVEDSLQSWVNQFPIRNDDIHLRTLVQRLGDSRSAISSPLGDASELPTFVNYGPKWYLVKAVDGPGCKVVGGLEIANELQAGAQSGVNHHFRINERYTFLTNQREDLKASINDLLGIIDEMDKTMIEEFTKTYNQVNEEFKKVFRELFKGGNGELVLTEPLNMLETGIDIIAEPPGKKLKSISLLSGGEKTLTAIALLFAILNVKTVPFCILDEVEAALDEANVDTFGNYLKDYKNKTQFIVITHKKKTMEYANTLYGVTMQESGVSKLVSVKLDGIK